MNTKLEEFVDTTVMPPSWLGSHVFRNLILAIYTVLLDTPGMSAPQLCAILCLKQFSSEELNRVLTYLIGGCYMIDSRAKDKLGLYLDPGSVYAMTGAWP